MNPTDIYAWCAAAYSDLSETELTLFTGECIAMNIDPRMRPKVVTPRRNPETGSIYAHRHTDYMEFTAEQIMRERNQRGLFGRETVWRAGTCQEHTDMCAIYGATAQGDLVATIPYTIDESPAYEAEVNRRYNEIIASISDKPTLVQRVALREEIRAELGPKPQPRLITGVGILPAAYAHETAGRRAMTREQRVVNLAKRDALDQQFPNMFAVR